MQDRPGPPPTKIIGLPLSRFLSCSTVVGAADFCSLIGSSFLCVLISVTNVVVAAVGGGEGLFANGGNCPFLCPINESHFNGSLLFFC